MQILTLVIIVRVGEGLEKGDYGNKFHHDSNPTWQTEIINDQELLDFSKRTISFIKLFTALLGKMEYFSDDPKEKTQQNQCLAGF